MGIRKARVWDRENQKYTKFIVCKKVGVMPNRLAVWEDIQTGEQYFLSRKNRRTFFYKIKI